MVYYRKYRPQRIAELDNASVRASLQAIFRVKNAAESSDQHAFLFTGPKGLGKTSSARIVAKVADCIAAVGSRVDGFEPCNQCDVCVSITNGTNMDVLEIDAASNRGIDEIRDLKEKIRLAPFSAKKKVYIIDEVHMLTTEAFNALLKTLEEPPSHALFILCTTEAHKLPDTIISRCFHVSFSQATEEELIRSLRRVVDGEKLSIGEDGLQALVSVVHKMNGGFRDATKMLEEVVLLANGEAVTKAWFELHFPAANVFVHVKRLLGALKHADMKSALSVVAGACEQGVDMRFFISEILVELHRKLLRQLGVEKNSAGEAADELPLSLEEIRQLSELFQKAYQEMKTAVLPQLPLELAIVDVCMRSQDKLQELGSVPKKEEESRSQTSASIAQAKDVSVDSLRKQVGMINKHKALYGEDKIQVKPAAAEISVETINLMDVPGAGEMTKEWLGALWRSIIAEMKQYNHTVAGVLRSCTIDTYTSSNLVIATAYAFHKERLDDVKTKTALINVCKILTGKEVEVTVKLVKN